jgi:hypothetical protein
LQTRLKQLSANAQGEHATEHQHRKAEQQIQRAYVFVVGRKDPTAPAAGRVVLMVMRMIVVI